MQKHIYHIRSHGCHIRVGASYLDWKCFIGCNLYKVEEVNLTEKFQIKKIGVGFMIMHTKSFGNTEMAHKSKIIPSYPMPNFEVYVGLQTVQKFATLHTELLKAPKTVVYHILYT